MSRLYGFEIVRNVRETLAPDRETARRIVCERYELPESVYYVEIFDAEFVDAVSFVWEG